MSCHYAMIFSCRKRNAATSFLRGDIDQFTEEGLNAAQRRWRHYKNRVDEGAGAMSAMSMYKVPAY